MRKKRINDIEISNKIFSNDRVIISEVNDEITFEIGSQITTDVAEAVAILMHYYDKKNKIWDIEFNKSDINPDKSLFWLSGGIKEWSTLEHYNKPWFETYDIYVNKYGNKILDIINKANTLGEIRKEFTKYLNLNILYEFALSKDLVRINI